MKKCLCLLGLMFQLGALSALGAWPIETTDEAVKGEWMNDFAAATNLAWQTRSPMVLFWANAGCEYCEDMEAAIKSSGFVAWRKAHAQYIYVFVYASHGTPFAPNSDDATTFARTAAGTMKALNEYPFVCLYWPQHDGSVKTTRRLGRASHLDSTTYKAGGSLEEEFEACLEKYFAGYVEDGPISFVSGTTEATRLEAEPTTKRVYVQLTRSSGVAKTTTLRVTWPDGTTQSREVAWAANQTTACPALEMPFAAEAFPVGQTATLTLLDADGATADTATLAFVAAVSNGVTNPYWIGEKTAANLDWADWTLDWTTVTQKVAAVKAQGEAAYTLAVYSGVLWCPYCKGMETSLFASDEFKAWATDNHVQLALFDQALSPTDTYAGKAHLLSYEAGEEHFNAAGSRTFVSGAPYLSRHGLSPEAAAVVSAHARAVDFSFNRWKAPESTAVRLSTPNLLLINAAGDVVGRFSSWRTADKVYEPSENVTRLNDLLKLATRADESSDYASTTRRTLGMTDQATATYQVNDVHECFALTGLATGTLTVQATGARAVTLELLVNGSVVASGENAFEALISKDYLTATSVVVRTTGAMPEKLEGTSSVFSASIVSTFEPGTGNDTFEVPTVLTVAQTVYETDASVLKTFSVKLVDGKLPTGLKLSASKKTGLVTITGSTKKTGSYDITYRVTAKTTSGETVMTDETLTLVVKSVASVNTYLAQAWSVTVPLLTTRTDGKKELSAIVLLSHAKAGRLTAKLTRVGSRAVSYSGKWSEVDCEAGSATASLVKSSSTLSVDLTANTLSVALGSLSGTVAFGDTAAYDGYYHVTFPMADADSTSLQRGTAYGLLTLKKGKASLKVMLPTGRSFSVTAVGAVDATEAGYLIVPVLYTSSSDVFSALLRVQANAKDLYKDEMKVRVIREPLDQVSWWTHTIRGVSTTGEIAVYGGYYVKGTTIDSWLSLFGGSSLTLMVDGEAVQGSYRFTKTTGLVSGSLTLMLDGSKVKGTFAGALMPGWLDCGCVEEEYEGQYVERPFASGSFHYTTKVGKTSMVVSLPLDLKMD